MTILKVLKFPNENLFKKSDDVKNINKIVIKNMIETLIHYNGLGIAAPQVNIHQNIIIINISKNYTQPLVMINPKIIYKSGTIISKEGCLSFPNIYINIRRNKIIKIKFQNIKGEYNILKANYLLSICIQHEIDHLNGITLYHKMSYLKRNIFLKKIK